MTSFISVSSLLPFPSFPYRFSSSISLFPLTLLGDLPYTSFLFQPSLVFASCVFSCLDPPPLCSLSPTKISLYLLCFLKSGTSTSLIMANPPIAFNLVFN
mmetsp:Transcript_29354/g.77098  ORF Transcript_29354/g.77098 Transcript_29354/m.77098 type:complete len:100 (+) Transcript_29354:175-474(+)